MAKIPVTAGQTYEATAWVKGNVADDGSYADDFALLVGYFDGAGNQLSYIGLEGGHVTESWQQIGDGHTFVPPAGVEQVEIWLYSMYNSGWVSFDDIEVKSVGVNQTIRKTYLAAGQPIAINVSGDPAPENNGLFYIYTDHLGSASTIVDGSDGAVKDSTRYLPFGGYRDGSSGSSVTDRGFTGHLQNDELGLIYMNARFYVPGVGRFASADTIVPDPANPQSYNRYSYVLNNPEKYTDPSGYCAEFGDGDCWSYYERSVNMCPECNINPDYGLNYQIEMFNLINNGWRPKEYNRPLDAIGVGSSGDLDGGLGIDAGVELVYNFNSGDITLFAILGGSLTFGGDVSGSIHGVLIYNIGEDNLAYKGAFHYVDAGVAAGIGANAAYARTPGDPSLCSLPCSVYSGVKVGAAGYVSLGRVEYIPLATIDGESGEVVYHANDYLHGDMAPVENLNELLSPTGPYRALFQALDTAISDTSPEP